MIRTWVYCILYIPIVNITVSVAIVAMDMHINITVSVAMVALDMHIKTLQEEIIINFICCNFLS